MIGLVGVVLCGLACGQAGGEPAGAAAAPLRVVVNEYFGLGYATEPVSIDVPVGDAGDVRLALTPGVSQQELVRGADGQRLARLWTLVSFSERGQRVFEVVRAEAAQAVGEAGASAPRVIPAGEVGGVRVEILQNGLFACKVPAGSAEFDPPVSAFGLPGPVFAIGVEGGAEWIGRGYLDTMLRVRSIRCTTQAGPVFVERAVVYELEGGRRYSVRLRLFAGKPFVLLEEEFDLGGASRFVFNFGDFEADGFFKPGDARLTGWGSMDEANPCGDFIQQPGQRCLARLCVWSQFNYFAGKQETIGLRRVSAMDQVAYERLAAWDQETERVLSELRAQKRPKAEVEAAERERRGGRPLLEGASLAVGGFYVRPDLWTRAKVNHVDLFVRPEVRGDAMTRGVVGLRGSEPTVAMEAWLVDGRRQWAMFAVAAGRWEVQRTSRRGPDGAQVVSYSPRFETNAWLAKAHLLEGVWPLDRIQRLALVWNADGSAVALEQTAAGEDGLGFGGDVSSVLRGTGGRSGLQHFNGSNASMRGGYARQAKALLDWATGWSGPMRADALREAGQLNQRMVGPAMAAYLAVDESTYPGYRAMLPWSHPEALNPFYQGMENQNFNADRYNSVSALGAALVKMGHPEGQRFLLHGREQMDMALDRYVYPESGCWEESHTYAGHTLKNLTPLAFTLRDGGVVNFFDDVRFARMFGWWTYTCSPRDPGFGGRRIQPPIGDHGVSLSVPDAFKDAIGPFSQSSKAEIRRIAGNMAWLMQERGAPVPEGITAVEPDLSSRYVQGHGVVMRSRGPDRRESFLTLRAEQSWGHHHADKGSLWFWGRDVHFFGDAAWGSPPGGTYGNAYKQGPASGTQIEFVGVNNWTLPCKYPAPWIEDDAYTASYDYALARCDFPYNPRLDLRSSTPEALANRYDRQVLFVHPDVLVVRDNVETMCETVWRMHSYQVDGTQLLAGGASLSSPQGVTAEVRFAYPDGVKLVRVDRDDLNGTNQPFGRAAGEADERGRKADYDTRSCVLRWDMPPNTSATWTVTLREGAEPAATTRRLDESGRVTLLGLGNGREVVVLMSNEVFSYRGEGLVFEGKVGFAERTGANGAWVLTPVRATLFEAK